MPENYTRPTRAQYRYLSQIGNDREPKSIEKSTGTFYSDRFRISEKFSRVAQQVLYIQRLFFQTMHHSCKIIGRICLLSKKSAEQKSPATNERNVDVAIATRKNNLNFSYEFLTKFATKIIQFCIKCFFCFEGFLGRKIAII